jgi:hydroxyacylglutathione hydrolase
MSKITVFPIPAFTDNYIWCISQLHKCVVVDPGDAQPVLDHCRQNQLTLSAILITHHHWDHTGGLSKLLENFPDIPVYGPAVGDIEYLSHKLAQGAELTLPDIDLRLSVLDVPGHTLDHIAYVSDIGLFCGDTLFSAGCGRLFEGTPKQMNQSLGKLMKLPDHLPVYCTHEYTLANLEFAQAVEPHNVALQNYTKWAKQQREQDFPTLPSTIGQEKAINPFLRTQEQAVVFNAQKHSGETLQDSDKVFAAIRGWKDNF